MSDHQLATECGRAADDFLALDWGASKSQIRFAVHEVVAGSNLYTISLEFLLEEARKIPSSFEPVRRLNDLVNASAALRTRSKRTHLVEMWRRGVA